MNFGYVSGNVTVPSVSHGTQLKSDIQEPENVTFVTINSMWNNQPVIGQSYYVNVATLTPILTDTQYQPGI